MHFGRCTGCPSTEAFTAGLQRHHMVAQVRLCQHAHIGRTAAAHAKQQPRPHTDSLDGSTELAQVKSRAALCSTDLQHAIAAQGRPATLPGWAGHLRQRQRVRRQGQALWTWHCSCGVAPQCSTAAAAQLRGSRCPLHRRLRHQGPPACPRT